MKCPLIFSEIRQRHALQVNQHKARLDSRTLRGGDCKKGTTKPALKFFEIHGIRVKNGFLASVSQVVKAGGTVGETDSQTFSGSVQGEQVKLLIYAPVRRQNSQ